MSQDDLFAEVRRAKLDRLRQLGWWTVHKWGTEFWVHPQTQAYYKEPDALLWLEKHDANQVPGVS